MSLSPQTLYAEFHHCQTLLNPDQTHQTPGLLFELSPPFTRYLIIPIHIIIRRTPHPVFKHLLYSALSHYLTFCLFELISVYLLVSILLFQTPTPVLTYLTLTRPPIWTCKLWYSDGQK